MYTRSLVLMTLTLMALAALLSSCLSGFLPFTEDDQKVKGVWSGTTKTKCVSSVHAWSPNGTRLLWSKTPYQYAIWNPSTGELERVLENAAFRANAAWSDDGTSIAGLASTPNGSTYQNEVAVWNSSTGKVSRTVKLATTQKIRSGVFGTNLGSVATLEGVGVFTTVRLYSLTDGSRLRELAASGAGVIWERIVFSADGSRLLGFGSFSTGTESGAFVRILDVATGTSVRQFPTEDNLEYDFLDPTGSRVYSGNTNGTRLLEVGTGTTKSLEGRLTVAASLRDGSKIVSIDGGSLDVFDWATSTRSSRTTATGLPDTDRINLGEFTQIAIWIASNGTFASIVSNARISDLERKCELQLRSLATGSLVRTLGEKNDMRTVKLDLQAQGASPYTVTGTATIDGATFSVQGSGRVVVPEPGSIFYDLTDRQPGAINYVESTPGAVTLELRDAGGKPTWTLETDGVIPQGTSGGAGGITGTLLAGRLKNLITTSDQFYFSFYNRR
jgi:hypothetical protein